MNQNNRMQYMIPAWSKGDKVEHIATGLTGRLVEPATLGFEVWKIRWDGHGPGRTDADMARAGRLSQVHARELRIAYAPGGPVGA